MTKASQRASVQAKLLSAFCKEAAELLERFKLEFALAECGFHDDKALPDTTPKAQNDS